MNYVTRRGKRGNMADGSWWNYLMVGGKVSEKRPQFSTFNKLFVKDGRSK